MGDGHIVRDRNSRLTSARARAGGPVGGGERLQLRDLRVPMRHLAPPANTTLTAPVCAGGDACIFRQHCGYDMSSHLGASGRIRARRRYSTVMGRYNSRKGVPMEFGTLVVAAGRMSAPSSRLRRSPPSRCWGKSKPNDRLGVYWRRSEVQFTRASVERPPCPKYHPRRSCCGLR